MMLLTAGTRGDVEPFVALSRYAAARGHEVLLAVPDDAPLPARIDAFRLAIDFRP